VPGRVVGTGVDWIDGENLLILRVGQERTGIAADVIGTERHIATEARGFEMLVGEVEIGAQSIEPCRAWKGPESEGVSGSGRRVVVVDDLVGSQQGDSVGEMKGREEQLRGIEVCLLSGVTKTLVGNESINQLSDMGCFIIPERTTNIGLKRR
jgi:hypothetical protein